MSDKDETKPKAVAFDFETFPSDTLFHDRREGRERRNRGPNAHVAPVEKGAPPRPAPERREKKERRRRIDPTTFEKQYTDDELEFMNAMQRYKVQSGKSFPSHGDVLKVAFSLGYRKVVDDDDLSSPEPDGPPENPTVAPTNGNGSHPPDANGLASVFESE